jgi:hypothetical protein
VLEQRAVAVAQRLLEADVDVAQSPGYDKSEIP